jgi:hypothetical protein
VGEVGGEVAEFKLAACEAISAHHIVQGAELCILEDPSINTKPDRVLEKVGLECWERFRHLFLSFGEVNLL